MRRENRKSTHSKSITDKIIIYSIIGIVILTIVLMGLLIYSKSLRDDVKNGTMTLEQMTDIANKEKEKIESVSMEIGKSIEEVEKEKVKEKGKEIKNDNEKNKVDSNVNVEKKNITPVVNKTENTNTVKSKKEETKKVKDKKELIFSNPVDGEIIKDFAKDNLVYSETLKEWITHLGIDIKVGQTTMVKAAEAGTVKKIKNDPRYGLTVIIEHENGFQTVYSNLLTAEFVVENEKVEKGQSLGTVGNTASFESADESHLHFEMKKDGVNVDPKIYIK